VIFINEDLAVVNEDKIIILQHPNPTDNDQFGNNFTNENRLMINIP